MVLCLCAVSCLKVSKKSDVEDDSIKNAPVITLAVEPQAEPEAKRLPVVIRIEETLNITENTEFVADDIYISENVKIYTNEFQLKLKADRIFLLGQVSIFNFSETNRVAPFLQHGKNGGSIEIKTNTIEGKLFVSISGQNGSQGIGGWVISDMPPWPSGGSIVSIPIKDDDATIQASECKPGSGYNAGKVGTFLISSNKSENFYLNSEIAEPQGGSIGEIEEFILIRPDQRYRFKEMRSTECMKVPIRGQDGALGLFCKKLKADETPSCFTKN